MSLIAIYNVDDREWFGGVDFGWTKQFRLASIIDEPTARRIVEVWRTRLHAPTFRLVALRWRIRNAYGDRVTDRGSIADCRTLLDKYADAGLPGWSSGPYKILRVAVLPRISPLASGGTDG